ncbi:MAG: hypothetical protein Q4A15_07145 [Prevotellaceae bacterium]|nr:hypothetical protein [Prevotellaceae bacterium]
MALKDYFAKLRDERAEAVKAIAARTRKSPACISRWIDGSSEPDYANKCLIADALGHTVKEIFGDAV